MIEHIKKSLALNVDVEHGVNTANLQQLDALKQRLMDYIGSETGGYTFSIPIVGSIIFAIFCFIMPQLTIWEAIFRLNGWPDDAILGAIFPTGIVYGILIFVPAFLTARGSVVGLKSFLCVITGTGIIAFAFFLFSLIAFITGRVNSPGDLIGAILGLLFIVTSINCLNSEMCTKTVAFYLLHRVSRQQVIAQQSLSSSGKG